MIKITSTRWRAIIGSIILVASFVVSSVSGVLFDSSTASAYTYANSSITSKSDCEAAGGTWETQTSPVCSLSSRPDQDATILLSAGWLADCLNAAAYDHSSYGISPTDIANSKLHTAPLGTTKIIGHIIAHDDGKLNCDDPSNVQAQLNNLKYDDLLDFLVDAGCTRTNGGGYDGYYKCPYGDNAIEIKIFNNIIAKHKYGTTPVTLTGADMYYISLQTFEIGCKATAIASPNSSILNVVNDGESKYYNVTDINNSSGIKTTSVYKSELDNNANISTIPESVGWTTDGQFTCQELANMTGKYADAYMNWVQSNPKPAKQVPTPGTSTTDGTTKTCGSVVTGIGWIVCPVTTAVVGLNDAIWNMVSKFLTVNPLNQADAVYSAWGSIRSIANVLFVIFFLIIIFSQLTGAGITNYGIKKLLPRLIICAILVNISFVIIQIAVDLSNIAGASIINLLDSISPGSLPTWGNILDVIFGGAVTGGLVLGIAAMAPSSAFLLLMPMAVMGILALITALLTLIFRQAIIPVLAIIAPLAFVAYLLPNTEKWFKKWLDLLLPMLMLYPLAALVFGGAKFAAGVIVTGHEKEFLANLIGLIVLSAPLFSLPFLARQGGSILKAVQGGLSKLAENARAPLKNFAKDRAEAAQLNYENKRPSTALGGLVGFNRRNARQRRYNNKMRQDRKELNTAQLENQMNENTTGRMNDSLPQEAADRRTVRGTAMAKGEATKDKEAITTEISNESGRRASGQEAMDRLARAKDSGRVVESTAGIRQGLNPEHREIKKQAANLDTALKNQTSEIAHEARTSATDDGTGTGGTLQGQTLATQEVNNETIAAADKQEGSNRYNSDSTTLQVRERKAEAEQYGQSLKKQEDQLITEASAGTVEGTAKAVAAGMSEASIGGLQYAKRSSDIAESATRRDTVLAQEEYEKAIAPDRVEIPVNTVDRNGVPIEAGSLVMPETAAARAAAGTDTRNSRGIINSQAVAKQSGDKRDSDDVAARVILLNSMYGPTELMGAPPEIEELDDGSRAPYVYKPMGGAQIEFDRALASGDSQGLRAAYDILSKAEVGRDKIEDSLFQFDQTFPPETRTTQQNEAIKDLRSTFLTSSIKDKNNVLGVYGYSDKPIADIRAGKTAYSNLTPTDLGNQTEEVIRRGAMGGFISLETADQTLRLPNAATLLSPTKRKLLEDIVASRPTDPPIRT